MNVLSGASATRPRPRILPARREAPPWDQFALLAAAGVVALQPLARFWSATPDYFFGWGVPLLAAGLFLERWPGRPICPDTPIPIRLLSQTALRVIGGLALLVDRLLEETEPGWRPGLWVGMGLYVAALLGWLRLYGGRPWLRHFAFPVAFLLLAVPWPFNLELPVVQGLMRLNAVLVADSLVLADFPAQAAGNTIELATGRLGVEEACSGIRSLQAAIMMSVFLGEFHRLAWRRRLVLPILAVALALAGNYARLLFLAWRGARAGLPAVEAAHDSAGLGILVFTVVGLWLASLRLARATTPEASGPAFVAESFGRERDRGPALRWAMGLLLAALLAEGFTQGWYAWREKTAPRYPAWTVSWPAGARNFQPIPLSPATRELLDYDAAKTGRWRDAAGRQWQAIWLRYLPRPGNKIVFDSHNPEICLPGAGLREARDEGEFAETVRGIRLPVHAYLFASEDGSEQVYWIAYRHRGTAAGFGQREGIYGRSPAAFFERSAAWFRDAWEGCRGADAETLEVTLAGEPDDLAARRACVEFLREAIRPEASPAPPH